MQGTGLWLAGDEGIEKKMDTSIGFRGLWLTRQMENQRKRRRTIT